MKNILINLISSYKRISGYWALAPVPFPAAQCKFHPSCSEYAMLAIDKDGVVTGVAKSLKRIIKCNPFSKGGVDLP